MTDDRGTLQPGTRFHDRYRVVRVIRVGGMGTIYEVVDERTNTSRALKLLLPSLTDDRDQRDRFEREARITGELDTDHVVRVLDAGHVAGVPFLVMELLRGEDLQSVLRRRKRLSAHECIDLLSQVARTLEKTHARKIVHRDLKPDNLFLTHREDGSPCIKILDFGIAKVVQEGEAQRTKALGTPLFMAPEQARGRANLGPAADLYALGHVAYALLVGEPYFAVESSREENVVALMMTILEGAKEAPTARARARTNGEVALPPAFDAWFLRATARDPLHRHASAIEEIEQLRAVYTAAATSAPPTRPALQVSPAATSVGGAPMQPAGATWARPAPMVGIAPPHAQPHPAPATPVPTHQSAAPGPLLVTPVHAHTLVSVPTAKSRAPLVIGLVLAAVLLLGGAGALLLGSSASSRSHAARDTDDDTDDEEVAPSKKKPKATAAPMDCGGAIACASIAAADPRRAAVDALVEQSHVLVRGVEKDARWVGIYVVGMSASGEVDATGTGAFTSSYATDANTITVSTNARGLVVNKIVSMYAPAATTPAPECPLTAAIAKASPLGFAPGARSSALYAISVYTQKPTWQLSAEKQIVYLDATDCTVLQDSKW